MARSDFDVIVVGAGSAGCALAGHLCQAADLRVCLVEAGPDYGPVASGQWPVELFDVRRRGRTHDWGYVEERPDGRTVPVSRAKVVGGCSAHNQCAALWGLPADYDGWAAAGSPDWSAAAIAPLIQQVEAATSDVISPYRGRQGAVPTRPYREDELATWQRWFLEGALGLGFPRLADLSAPEPVEGVAPFHANVQDAVRWNAAFAFLDPVRPRPNLTILSETVADRLVLQQGAATSLVCRTGDEAFALRGRRFVLCAGTYGSPAVLLRSGIGPATHIQDLGIPLQLDLSGVGQNLHDHPGISLRFAPSPIARQALVDDLAHGRLYWSQVILRANSRSAAPTFDLHLLPYQAADDADAWRFEILVFHMAPRSRGRLRLRGREAALPPVIHCDWLSDPERHDAAVLREGLRLARRLAGAAPLATAIVREVEPGEPLQAEEDLDAYIQAHVTGYAHPVGTCKMGPASDPTAVVDSTGRVHGTNNVFVADASIMPHIPRANPNLTCFLIGLRAADLLLAAR
jgi:choline dehydrogenase